MSIQTGKKDLNYFLNSIIYSGQPFVDSVSANSLSRVLLFYYSYPANEVK